MQAIKLANVCGITYRFITKSTLTDVEPVHFTVNYSEVTKFTSALDLTIRATALLLCECTYTRLIYTSYNNY